MLLRREDGAVSLYLIIIIAALFAFIGLFIDYARIAAANKKTEDALKAGVRSVMSAYDWELQQKYGLFAFGQNDGDAIMQRVLEQRLGVRRESNDFVLLDTELESASLTFGYGLGNDDVFRRQIMEEMKYRAPIDFTFEVIGRFKGIAGQMKEASHVTKTLGKLQQAYEQRLAHLEQALSLQRQARDEVQTSGIDVLIGTNSGDAGSLGTVQSAAKIAAVYNSYIQAMYEDALREPEDQLYEGKIAAYRSSARSVASSLHSELAHVGMAHADLLERAIEEIERADRSNRQMRQILDEADERPYGDGYDRIREDQLTEEAQGNLDEDAGWSGLVERSGDLVLADGFFERYRSEIALQRRTLSNIEEASERFVAAVDGSLGEGASVDSVEQMKAFAAAISAGYDDYRYSYIHPGQTIREQEEQLDDLLGDHLDIERARAETSVKLGEAQQLLDRFNELKRSAEAGKADFLRLDGFYEQILHKNEEAGSPAPDAVAADDPEQAAADAMAMMDGVFTGLAGALDRMVERIYIHEYAIDRFTRFEPELLQGLMTGEMTDVLNRALSVDTQETEYIIYGFAHPGSNIAAAYSELFMFRLAIRTMEGFGEAKGAGHPLLVFAGAVSYGLSAAIRDLYQLLDLGQVELSKSVPVKLVYRDYLRLFLFLHGQEKDTLARMLALMQFNTGRDVAGLPTYSTGEASVSVRLWFIPGLIRLVNAFGILEGKMEGNRYVMKKTAAYSY